MKALFGLCDQLYMGVCLDHQGVVIELEETHGFIKYPQDPKLFFDLKEVMEETQLVVSEKVEFTVMPVSGPEA